MVVTKQEILVISLTDFYDAASWRHNDVILLPAIRRVCGNNFVPVGQCTGTPRRARATVELLRQETPNFLASKLWPPNSPDLSPVEYDIWAVMHHRVYHRQIHSEDEYYWNGGSSMSNALLNSRFLTRLLTSGEEDTERMPVLKEDISSIQLVNWQCWFYPYLLYSIWLVWLLHLSLRWPIHSSSFSLAILRYGGRF